jgi:hypothetical protein
MMGLTSRLKESGASAAAEEVRIASVMAAA